VCISSTGVDGAGPADGDGHASSAHARAGARELPFRNASFNFVVSVTALCFIHDQRPALQEIVRVTRKRLAPNSLPWGAFISVAGSSCLDGPVRGVSAP